MKYLKVLKKEKHQPTILYPVKLSSKGEGKIYKFPLPIPLLCKNIKEVLLRKMMYVRNLDLHKEGQRKTKWR